MRDEVTVRVDLGRLGLVSLNAIVCTVPGKLHFILSQKSGVDAHSIGSVCLSCRISLWDHTEAINSESPVTEKYAMKQKMADKPVPKLLSPKMRKAAEKSQEVLGEQKTSNVGRS